MKAFVVYDETGKIYSIEYGGSTYRPKNFQTLETEVEDGSQIMGVNVSGDSPKLTVVAPKEKVLEKELAEMKRSNDELWAQIAYLSMMSGIEMEVGNE